MARACAILTTLLAASACGDDDTGSGGGDTSSTASSGATQAASSGASSSTGGLSTTSATSTGTGQGGEGGQGGAGGSGAGGDGDGGAGGAGGGGGQSAGGGGGGLPLSGECFGEPEVAQEYSGTGTCDDPFALDLSVYDPGEALVMYVGDIVGAPFGTDEVPNPSYGSACSDSAILDGTTTDFVFRMTLPAGVEMLEVSVDPVAGADPRVGVFEASSCGQPLNACADEFGPGECEYVAARPAEGDFFGTETFVIISEIADDPATKVRFRYQ